MLLLHESDAHRVRHGALVLRAAWVRRWHDGIRRAVFWWRRREGKQIVRWLVGLGRRLTFIRVAAERHPGVRVRRQPFAALGSQPRVDRGVEVRPAHLRR